MSKAARAADDAAPPPARVGPNAIIKVADVLIEQLGPEMTAGLFETAGIERHIETPPEHMVDEAEVTRLHRMLRRELAVPLARAVSREAGRRTGDYLLARRIPRPAQAVLKLLPPALSSRLLLMAIERNAWTFVGSGSFYGLFEEDLLLTVTRCPICRGASEGRPVCDYLTGTFERLFSVLVHRDTVVTEIACEATGGYGCRFRVTWGSATDPATAKR